MIRPGMGTENSANLISALIRMARPKTVVEIGAGDSTIFIAQALQQALRDWQHDKYLLDTPNWHERTALLDPAGIPDIYQPRLITIDDFTAEGSSAQEAWSSLKNNNIDEHIVTLIRNNFFSISETTITSWGPIDIAWIDAGTPADDIRFVAALWEHIVPGGYLCLHEPTMLTTVSIDGSQRVRRVRAPVWEELFRRLDDSFELITLPELHKYRQSGLGVVRKRPNNERMLRSQPLQAGLIELGEIPIRSDYLPIGKEALQKRLHKNAITTALTSRETRSVYAAIILGAKSISDILGEVDVDIKTVNKIVTRLLGLGLIQQGDSGFLDTDSIWSDNANSLRHGTGDLSDRQIETDDVIEKITNAFALNVEYTEAEISKICRLFSTDYARLRRHLVDQGVLQRQNNIYRRARV